MSIEFISSQAHSCCQPLLLPSIPLLSALSVSSLIWTVKTSEWGRSLYVSKRLHTHLQRYLNSITLV